MSYTTTIEHAARIAGSKGMAVYVVTTADGFRAVLFCDDCPTAVVAVVGESGVIWSKG